MNIGTARNMGLAEQRHAEFWMRAVDGLVKKKSWVKARLAVDMAAAHLNLVDLYDDWMREQKREEKFDGRGM